MPAGPGSMFSTVSGLKRLTSGKKCQPPEPPSVDVDKLKEEWSVLFTIAPGWLTMFLCQIIRDLYHFPLPLPQNRSVKKQPNPSAELGPKYFFQNNLEL